MKQLARIPKRREPERCCRAVTSSSVSQEHLICIYLSKIEGRELGLEMSPVSKEQCRHLSNT